MPISSNKKHAHYQPVVSINAKAMVSHESFDFIF
jgi:hypothetical protein